MFYDDMRILEYKEFLNRESKTRTKPLEKEEFLKLVKENCKNFSFNNDRLWRKFRFEGDYGLFVKSERKNTIGDYGYKDFFDTRTNNPDYPVERHSSLIGSTTPEGASFFGTSGYSTINLNDIVEKSLYLVIPFDNTKIVFAPVPDLAFLGARLRKRFRDNLFIMKEYNKGFKVPTQELDVIKTHYFGGKFDDKPYGFEFFTNGPCLLINKNELDWLKSEI